jgi:hypothetical protein
MKMGRSQVGKCPRRLMVFTELTELEQKTDGNFFLTYKKSRKAHLASLAQSANSSDKRFKKSWKTRLSKFVLDTQIFPVWFPPSL